LLNLVQGENEWIGKRNWGIHWKCDTEKPQLEYERIAKSNKGHIEGL